MLDTDQETTESSEATGPDTSETTSSAPDTTEEPQDSSEGRGIDVEEIDDFAAVLAEFEGSKKAVKEGSVVLGTILKVLEKEVIVDIGYTSIGWKTPRRNRR